MLPTSTTEQETLETLIEELEDLHALMVQNQNQYLNGESGQIDPNWRKSAANLMQYLELRHHDLRPLQSKLARLGLSSLGRAEAHVYATFHAVLRTLHQLAGHHPPPVTHDLDFSESGELIRQNTLALLGDSPKNRAVRIMVTMPSEAATDSLLVKNLVEHGMDCMRINCAHDDEKSWSRMIENLRQAERHAGRKCTVLMDLAGPKLRTGAVNRQAVFKIKPQRDELGRVIAAARIWLYPAGYTGSKPRADAHIPFQAESLAEMVPGDTLRFKDTRGAQRKLNIVAVSEKGFWAESTRTFYLVPGLAMVLRRTHRGMPDIEVQVQQMEAVDPYIVLKKNDTLFLTRSQEPGRDAVYDKAGRMTDAARIPCTLPEVFDFVATGEPVWLDDGKIGGTIVSVAPQQIEIKITQVPGSSAKLRADKGINLPDTRLNLPALTNDDLANLPFVARHADIVGMSFAERPEDVLDLCNRLNQVGEKRPGIILKIETRRAFEALPGLILAAMHNPRAGVMIARGDLAVECGFERLAELQEEILWICEAAHMPVIWATQVLETLAKSGQPSRAEITDAAMGERAECVMLNKGPHILRAMKTLDSILQRMQAHQHKKQALLRPLRSWIANPVQVYQH